MEFSFLSFVAGAVLGAGALSLRYNWSKLFKVEQPAPARKKRAYTRKPKATTNTPSAGEQNSTPVPNGRDNATLRSVDTYQS